MAIAGRDAAILTVSVAAELAGMHPQTVRQYDRMGLVPAKRTRGGGRRYSLTDVDKLVAIQDLSQKEGINLAGISRIFALQTENEQLRQKNARLRKRAQKLQDHIDQRQALDQRVFAADVDGDVMLFRRAKELRRRHGANESGRAGAGRAAGGQTGDGQTGQSQNGQTRAGQAGAGQAGQNQNGRTVTRYSSLNAEIVVWRPQLPEAD